VCAPEEYTQYDHVWVQLQKGLAWH